MGKGGSSSIDVDPEEVFRSAAYWNRINQTTPYGSIMYSPDRTSMEMTLSPELQAQYDLQNQMSNALTGIMGDWFGINFQNAAVDTGGDTGDTGDYDGDDGDDGGGGGGPYDPYRLYEHESIDTTKTRTSDRSGEPTDFNVAGNDRTLSTSIIPADPMDILSPDVEGNTDPRFLGEKPAPRRPSGRASPTGFSLVGTDDNAKWYQDRGIDFGSLEAMPTLSGYQDAISDVEQTTFDRAMSLLAPEFERRESSLRSTMANRGIPVGSEIFADEFDILNTARGESELKAAMDAVLAGRGEHSRLFGLGLGARQQGFGEQMQDIQLDRQGRTQMFNELMSVLGGSQAQLPQLGGFYQPGGVDATGAYSLQQQGALANMQNQSSTKAGIGNLLGMLGGGALTMASHSSFKKDISDVDGDKIIEGILNIPVKKWRYKNSTDNQMHIGPMAEDFNAEFAEDDSSKGIFMGDAIGVLFKGVQEILRKLEKLEKQNA